MMDFYRFKLGKFDCAIIKDLDFVYQAKDFAINATKEELEGAVTKYHGKPDVIPSPYIALWVDTGSSQLLIDTGIGYSETPLSFQGKDHYFKGQLLNVMRREGINPAEIDTVVLTHFHPDHIGGVFNDDEKLNFPNANFVFFQKEWNYWFSDAAQNIPYIFSHFINKQIAPLKDVSHEGLKEHTQEIYPGIHLLFTPGHTPGHMAVRLESQGQHLLYISDAVLHPMCLENPHWQTAFDFDQQLTYDSKIKLVEQAVKENYLVCAFHFPFPCLGYFKPENDHWIWEPMKLD